MEKSLVVKINRPWEIHTKTTEASGVHNRFSSSELHRLRATFIEMTMTSVPITRPKVREIL